jgi:2-isopropylmalate synthase
MNGLRVPVRIQHYEERALTQGANARAIAIAEMAGAQVVGSAFGVGIDANLVTASIRAVINGINRAYVRYDSTMQPHFFDGMSREAGGGVVQQQVTQAG